MSSLSLPWDDQPAAPNNINHVMENDEALRDKINGNIDADNLTPAEAVKLGLTAGAIVRRGKSIIATEEVRTNVAYGLMTTPDRVSGIVLPTDGILCVALEAMWKESVDGAGKAALFIGANQLQGLATSASTAPVAAESGCLGGVSIYSNLVSYWGGITSTLNPATDYTGPVTTGQVIGGDITTGKGGVAFLEAAAGTYDISIQFKSSSGTVTAKNRKLWVWTMGF